MPLMTEAASPEKRRSVRWLLIPGGLFLFFVGLLVWGWFQPINTIQHGQGIGWGYVRGVGQSGRGWWWVEMPGFSGRSTVTTLNVDIPTWVGGGVYTFVWARRR